MLLKLAARLEMFKEDRGDGPIPYVIMVAIITAAAAAIGLTLVGIANGWVAKIPR